MERRSAAREEVWFVAAFAAKATARQRVARTFFMWAAAPSHCTNNYPLARCPAGLGGLVRGAIGNPSGSATTVVTKAAEDWPHPKRCREDRMRLLPPQGFGVRPV